jgi:hypothetical protein
LTAVTSEENKTTYYSSRPKELGSLLIAATLAATSIWMLLDGVQTIAATYLALLSVPGVVLGTIRTLRHKPRAVFTERGFTSGALGFVAWDEIRHVGIVQRDRTLKVIAITLKDPNAYRARVSPRIRKASIKSERKGFGALWISPQLLSASLDEIINVMRTHHPDLKIAHQGTV